MHIPDAYMGPQFSLPVLAAMIPYWSLALNRVKKTFNFKQIPLLSLCAAFSFIIMMFNVPLGPSSVHAIGAVFVAVLIGPWAASVAISIALIIQAVVFGDGGIMAIGANCFNMAVAMPFAGYYTYRFIAGNSSILSKRSMAGVFLGGYIGLNLAALLTAVEFGIQPMLFKAEDGTPLYGFFPLSVSIPAIMFEHLLVAGPVEGVITASAIAYIARFSPHLLNRVQHTGEVIEGRKSFFSVYKWFIIGLLILVILAPIGLLSTGTAWGEWSIEEIKQMVPSVPAGFAKLSDTWKALIPDYTVPGLDKGFLQSSAGYIVSAVIGILLITGIMLASGRLISRKDRED